MVEGFLNSPLPALNDEEGQAVPAGLPRVIDAHVHLFPENIFEAVWKWFDAYGWPIRYRMRSRSLLKFLFSHGIMHVVAFQYAHKPGIASGLNRYMADIVRAFPEKVTGMATVFPGEDGDVAILEKAFDAGLKGVKLHVHVQCFEITGPAMEPIYECCRRNGKPVVIHAGREPKSPAYACDPHELCACRFIEEVVRAFPDLRVCVPHLGMDELAAYSRLIETCNNLWLDTAMALTDYLPEKTDPDLERFRSDRIMYGSDFPNIPYAWDRELVWIDNFGLGAEKLDNLLWRNATTFFDIV